MSGGSTNAGQGILLMVLAICLYTLMDSVVKGLIDRYPAGQMVWARIAGQTLVVIVILRGRLVVLARTRFLGLHLFRAVTQLGATLTFFMGLGVMGLAEATALADIHPVLITLGAALFLGERLGPRRLAGVVVALAGTLIIIRPGLGVFSPWALLPLVGACFMAANALATRHVGPRESTWTAMIHGSWIAALLASLALPFIWVPIATDDIPAFVAIGLLGTAGQLCLIRAFTLAEAAVVAPFAYLGIITATFWGWLFWGDLPDGWTVVGAVVIAGAGLYVWHRETRVRRGRA